MAKAKDMELEQMSMGEIDALHWTSNMKKQGYHIQKGFFKESYLSNINKTCCKIINLEKNFKKLGFGNQTFRNGNIFTSNLLLKSNVFHDLLTNNGLLNFPSQYLEEFILSEYKIISSYKYDDFSYWWHRDYPYHLSITKENINLGIIIPLINFNENNGSTVYIPESHLLPDKPQDLDVQKPYSKQNVLETNLGDIFVYDGKLFHSGSKNLSGKLRNLISIQFVKNYITPCEDMKRQFFQNDIRNKTIENLMTQYHSPHIHKFGVNRNWSNTKYWAFLKYPYFVQKKIKNYYYKLVKLIYLNFCNQ
tara:strand:- start:184 stop:1101 length:918 start_codon:yes stop_codon:yes gene_type:complete